MINIKDIYIDAVNNGDEFLSEIGFSSFLEMNSILLNSKGFVVSNNQEDINKALFEKEEIWSSSKSKKITFMPASLNINDDLNLNEKLNIYHIKDNKSEKWKSFNVALNEEKIEVKVLNSSINLNEIIKSYNKLKIKDEYTLQIYKMKFDDMEKGIIFAFKDRDILPNITSENLITNDFEVVNLKFDEAEKSYLDAIDTDNSPEAYLQLVLLNNKLNEFCNSDDNYELIKKRNLIKEDNLIVEAPNFYYDDKGNITIEYFKRYDTYNVGYKRVINTFNKENLRFKIVDQFVTLYMKE
ncbi:MAG: hypothetical protein E7F58_04475 [Clostridium saudiense]|uniref:hypothetical protein n=1 Tax=Clostridium saudiense TaxID=1414720 RepID=UPI002911A55D|nr:hypothetical protein [Clostridium saudiense]MDU3520903.1 hypothetical protein [Clostridium saudiense]